MPVLKSQPRKERLAINLFDLDRIDPTVRSMMLQGKLDLKAPVWVDKNRPDEHAVVFICELLPAALVCDVIRHRDRKAGDYPTRVYVCRETWSKLSSEAVLTIVTPTGRARLNPKVFTPPPPPVVAPMPPAVRKRVTF